MTAERRLATALGVSTIVMVLAVAIARPQAMPDEEQQSKASDQEAAWNRLRSMVGTWTSGDDDGVSRTVQTYRLILQDKFLHVQTISTSATDNHEDWEILSYDSGRNKVVLRQFVSEGYVSRYVLDEVKADGPTFVFLSEASENAPPGFRLRQTLRFEDEHQITHELELAPRGQPFSKCAGGTLVRSGP